MSSDKVNDVNKKAGDKAGNPDKAVDKTKEDIEVHSCQFGDSAKSKHVHNFMHWAVDNFGETPMMSMLYNSFTTEEKQHILESMSVAESWYSKKRDDMIHFITYFDNQQARPIVLYKNAFTTLKIANDGLAGIANIRLFMKKWDSDETYDQADAEKVLFETAFIKTSKK
jgi:hypothetical protein